MRGSYSTPVLLLGFAFLVLLHACGGDEVSPATTVAPSATTQSPATMITVPSTPTPPTSLQMSTSAVPGTVAVSANTIERLSPDEVYLRVAPSVPFVETATGTGSGVLIEGGYIVTNYHVVWPYDAVWVVFPDGTELQDVPVVGWDPLADLAVLGPVNVSARPLELVDGESLAPGSELFLVGYPAEVDLFPQASITRGILSRFREWDRLGMTYLQTDAAIAGGQSGGALVNSNGEMVGISTFSFSEAAFGLATSAADDAPIVKKLIEGWNASGWSERRLPSGAGAFEFDIELVNQWDTRTFVLDPAAGSMHEFWIDGPEDGLLRLFDPFGLILEVDETYTGLESGTVEVQTEGIHFLQVEMLANGPSAFTVGSTIKMTPLNDPDDGRTISVGDTVVGSLDYFSEWDWFLIHLNEGETVRIYADSVGVDTLIYVDFPGSSSHQVVYDDDSGGGLSGTNSQLVYRAPSNGNYYIAVTGALDDDVGGYFLSVEPAQDGSETVNVPASRNEDTFDILISSDPVLGEYEPSTLREFAGVVCEAIDSGLPFDEILLGIYTESPADWDTDTAAIFLGSAVYGLCPEHADAMDTWIEKL